jgi:hypothetical protein
MWWRRGGRRGGDEGIVVSGEGAPVEGRGVSVEEA